MSRTDGGGQPFQISLRQVAVLVVFCAIQFALLSRLARSAANSFDLILVLAGVAFTPSYWALAILFIMKRGPLREWVNEILVAAQLTILMAPFSAIPVASFTLPIDSSGFLVVVGVVFFVGATFGVLMSPLFPRRCPACHRRRLIPEMTKSRLAQANRTRLSWCMSCGDRFRRSDDNAPWQPILEATPEHAGPPADSQRPHPLDRSDEPSGVIP